MIYENIFCITSTINVSNNPWSYTSMRSFWSSNQRFEQTIKQLKSIKNYDENIFIIFCEGSKITLEQELEIKKYVNIFINNLTNEIIENVSNSIYKGVGEMYLLKQGMNYIKENNIQYKRFFKFGGRFSLNKNFNINNFSNTLYTFKENENHYITILFSLCDINIISHKFDFIINELKKKNGIEYILFDLLKNNKNINTLGCQGFMGISPEYKII